MRYCALTLLLVLGLTGLFAPLASTAAAQEMSTARQVEALSQEGAEFFGQDEFEKAIDRFTQAYELQPVPNLLFNIARCYEEIEDWEQAENYYDQFMRSPEVDSDSRDLAMERIDAVREIHEAELEEQRKKEEELAARQAEEEAQERARLEELEQPNLTPAYITLGAGAGLLAGGTMMGLMARSNANTMSDTTLGYDERVDAQSSARTQGIVADVFFVSGLAAAVFGGYLFMSARGDASSLEPAANRALIPFADGERAGIELHLGF